MATSELIVFSSVLVTILFLQGALACFVTNCPPGGKRSAPNFPSASYRRQCMKCGPGGKGACFGTDICCGDAFGCYIGTEESAVCAKENYIRTPCYNSGTACGVSDKGLCAAEGICCSEHGCVLDQKCGSQQAGPFS